MLVDDHAVVREGLRTLLELDETIEVTRVAGTVSEALRDLPLGDTDIIVTDLSMPDQSGLRLIEAAKEKYPSIPVIVLSMHSEGQMVVDAIRAGANAYLTKSASRANLVEAIRAVQQGESYIQASVTLPLVQVLRAGTQVGCSELTAREKEILSLASKGQNNQRIAKELMLSISTVKTHMRSVFNKLEAKDRTQAVLEAVRRGLVRVPGAER
jgi:DNA-binding NarL/FixJ family response regulator